MLDDVTIIVLNLATLVLVLDNLRLGVEPVIGIWLPLACVAFVVLPRFFEVLGRP